MSADVVDVARSGHLCGVVDDELIGPMVELDAVLDAGRGGDEVEVELALETLLDDLHVEQAKESATEPEPEGG